MQPPIKIFFLKWPVIVQFVICWLMMATFSATAADKQPTPTLQTKCPEILFLPDRDFFPALTDVVDRATREIFICMFSFKAGVHSNSYPDRLVRHLASASRRGVRVVVILESTGRSEDSLTAQNLKTKELLEKIGAAVYMDSPKKTTHTKMIVVDGRHVFLGSHNFTSSGLKHNHEVSVLIRDEAMAQAVRRYMLKIIEEAP